MLIAKEKGKGSGSSNEVQRFRTPYHEAHFKKVLPARKVLDELIIEVDDEALTPINVQITMRKWQKLTKPIQAVGYTMVREFYANAWKPKENRRQSHSYTTMVRGKDISFAPTDIARILKLKKEPLPNVASYNDRKPNNLRLEKVQEYLCLEGGE
ncbi:hypothetical protein PIB30_005866 [Stylosanthes scabra]|uniref:Putative plant transposon protein domain-containing protein n=1 Tax=Stylosanthes scabra TaxID=79078 RepID=A0ABU6Q431_9FABA|nr:hypothetical protein [Stylosanthes scabra]